MNERDRREDFLQLDVMPGDLTERLRQQVADMLEKPLRLWERLVIAWVAGLSVVGGMIACGILLLRTDLAEVQRFHLFLALLLASLGAVWSFSTLRRGVLRPAKDEVPMQGVVWAFFVIVVCWELLLGRGEGAMADVIAAIVLVGFAFTWDRVRAAELRTRETILRMALHCLDRGQDAAPGSAQSGTGSIGTPRPRADVDRL